MASREPRPDAASSRPIGMAGSVVMWESRPNAQLEREPRDGLVVRSLYEADVVVLAEHGVLAQHPDTVGRHFSLGVEYTLGVLERLDSTLCGKRDELDVDCHETPPLRLVGLPADAAVPGETADDGPIPYEV